MSTTTKVRNDSDLDNVIERLKAFVPGAPAYLTPDEVRAILPKLRAAVAKTDAKYRFEAVADDGSPTVLARSDSEQMIRAAYWEEISRSPRRKLQIRRGQVVTATVAPLS
jgi:hypothetical protein